MQVYADPITVNCRKVLAGLDFLDAPFERVHVDYFKGEQKEPGYTSVNPNASVPALRDGDFVLWESNAILQYVADKLGRDSAYPRQRDVSRGGAVEHAQDHRADAAVKLVRQRGPGLRQCPDSL